jgi:hypothetical protein
LRVFSLVVTNGHGRSSYSDPDYPTMVGVDIRTATVQVTDGG